MLFSVPLGSYTLTIYKRMTLTTTYEKYMTNLRSLLMDQLYGSKLSKEVFENLENLDADLNKEIQEIAYERYWARPGISIRDKSLVTVVSLIALRKEKQTKPHMIGFFNTGGTKEELISVLHFLSKTLGFQYVEKAVTICCDILKENGVKEDSLKQIKISFQQENNADDKFMINRDIFIANIASCAAIGNQDKTESSIMEFLQNNSSNTNDVRNILIHQIIYCGFPVAVNGFAALKSAIEKIK